MSDYAFLGIAEAAELIRSRKLSPVEYTKALLARIDKLDKRFHAFIRLMPERALEDARKAEQEVMAGKIRGVLHGVPQGSRRRAARQAGDA
jgi:aspartyl-tRNA(Asn)/glutamyl-tRNA(Gln) amidotransferase subunit A